MAIKPVPQNIEAEEVLLGSILLDPECLTRVIAILKPELFSLSPFYVPAHRIIYGAIIAVYELNQPCDLIHVLNHLVSHNPEFMEVGGTNQLTQLVERVVSSLNADNYAQLVMDKFYRRRIMEVGRKIEELGRDSTDTLPDLLDQVETLTLSLGGRENRQDLVSLADTLVEVFTECEQRNSEPTEYQSFLKTEFYDLDAMMGGGLGRQDLVIIAGRPSMGKTALALGIAKQIAKTDPVAIYSLEMPRNQLALRWISGETQIESHRIRSGDVKATDWANLSHAVGNLGELDVWISDNTDPTISQMRSALRQLKAERGKLGLVLIDYLQLMESDGGDENRTQSLSRISRSLKKMAMELDTPVIAISQLSRGVEARNNKRPMMSDLRESGAIEQDADAVLMVYRDDYYDRDSPDTGIAEIIIAKQRNGPIGTIKLLFQSDLVRFVNLSSST